MALSWSLFGQLAQSIGPMLVSILNPKLIPIAGTIGNAIAEAEQLFGAGNGAQKLQHVLNVVDDVAVAANGFAGKTLVDQTELHTVATDCINTVVAVLNLLHGPVAAVVTK